MSDALIPRAAGDDVIVPVRMRKSSFERLTSSPDGHCVVVSAGSIGLVPDRPDDGLDDGPGDERAVWTFVVWSGEPVWHGVPEQIPGNEASAEALAEERYHEEMDAEWDDDDGHDNQARRTET